MANRTQPKPTAEESLDRARAAAERAQSKLDKKGTAPGDDEWDFRRAPLSEWRKRWDRATRRLFIENFIKIRDAFDKNKLVQMKFNDFQDDYDARRTGRDVRLKPRRLGSSIYELASDFCDALVLSNQHVRIVPHDPDTQEEFFDALQVMYDNLPDHLRVATTSFTSKLIKFHDRAKGTTGSKIKSSTVQPGHEAKGRGQAITHLRLTEVPHWRGNSKKAVTALIEAAQGGSVTVEGVSYPRSRGYALVAAGSGGEAGGRRRP